MKHSNTEKHNEINISVTQICDVIENDPQIYEMMKSCPYEVLRKMKLREFEAKEFIRYQDEFYSTMYIVIDGELDIYVDSENGKKYYLNTYRKGCYIGELEMFGNRPYVSRVEARTSVRLVELEREDFIRWVQIDRNMNDYFIRTLCESSYFLCQNMGNNSLHSLTQRLCQVLVNNAVLHQEDCTWVHISSEELAEQMAVTQRSVNRILKKLKDLGLIEISKKKIILKNIDGLIDQIKKEK